MAKCVKFEGFVEQARSEHELASHVTALSDQGFRIVAVFQSPVTDYFTIVAQKEQTQ